MIIVFFQRLVREAKRRLHNLRVLREAEKTGHLNLWLDDMRVTTAAGWYHAKDAEEAIEILSSWVVHHCSLDHDLGPGATGYQVLTWLAEELHGKGLNFWPKHKPVVHSANPVGRRNMQSVVDRYGPYKVMN